MAKRPPKTVATGNYLVGRMKQLLPFGLACLCACVIASFVDDLPISTRAREENKAGHLRWPGLRYSVTHVPLPAYLVR